MPIELVPDEVAAQRKAGLIAPQRGEFRSLIYSERDWEPWWTTSLPAKEMFPLRISQICPSAGAACGVGNFAANLAAYLPAIGCTVQTGRQIEQDNADLLLVQHEYGLYDTASLRHQLKRCRQLRVLFAHTRVGREFDDVADAYVCMCPGMVDTQKPVCVIPHPAYVAPEPESKNRLKDQLGVQDFAAVIGSSGFLTPNRRFVAIVSALLPVAVENNWLIQLLTSRHQSHHQNDEMQQIEAELLEWQNVFPRNFRFTTSFSDTKELNRRMQSCDLHWCWTASHSAPYGSGTCSDQYGSGRTVIVANKAQHSAVFGLPNVIIADAQLPKFLATLVETVKNRAFNIHDGSTLSWTNITPQLGAFLNRLVMKS
jgi:hypothetical protein